MKRRIISCNYTNISIYDGIFQAWDGLGKGAIGGEIAIEVFSQSGLPRGDLERIWYVFLIVISFQDSSGSWKQRKARSRRICCCAPFSMDPQIFSHVDLPSTQRLRHSCTITS